MFPKEFDVKATMWSQQCCREPKRNTGSIFSIWEGKSQHVIFMLYMFPCWLHHYITDSDVQWKFQYESPPGGSCLFWQHVLHIVTEGSPHHFPWATLTSSEVFCPYRGISEFPSTGLSGLHVTHAVYAEPGCIEAYVLAQTLLHGNKGWFGYICFLVVHSWH